MEEENGCPFRDRVTTSEPKILNDTGRTDRKSSDFQQRHHRHLGSDSVSRVCQGEGEGAHSQLPEQSETVDAGCIDVSAGL